jgi:hypothetical protein
MKLLSRQHVTAPPTGDELLPPKPALPASPGAAARKRAREVQEEAEAGREAARVKQVEDERREREQEAARLQDIQQARQREWAAERDRLSAELANAEAAERRPECAHGVDLSTPESAFASVQSVALRDAAAHVVADARARLEAHTTPGRR